MKINSIWAKKDIEDTNNDTNVEFKMNIRGNFIFGDIAETKETARETLDYLKKNCNY